MARVEARAVRRPVDILMLILCAVALLAAGPGASILGTPVLIVYPFSAGGDVSKEAGSRLAVTIATQIANLGGVDVKPAPAGVERPNYLDEAHRQGADYYIAGYITPLGDGVSLVEQLVSTQTGIVVYSNTAQVRTYADAAGQGDVLREALLRHQSRNLGAYAAPPPPAASATPVPAASGAGQANIGRLFSRKNRGAASAEPSPAASPPAEPPVTAAASPAPALPAAASPAPALPAAVATARHGDDFGVLAIGGPAETERRSFTGAAIRNDMIANHRFVGAPSETREAACANERVGTVLGGNLTTQNHTVLGEMQTIATLELLAYDCSGNVVYRKTFAHDARGDWKAAVDGVVSTAVTTFLHEPSANPHG